MPGEWPPRYRGPAPRCVDPLRDQGLIGTRQAAQLRSGLRLRLVELALMEAGENFTVAGWPQAQIMTAA